jgi:hypothetical protein
MVVFFIKQAQAIRLRLHSVITILTFFIILIPPLKNSNYINPKSQIANHKQIQISNAQNNNPLTSILSPEGRGSYSLQSKNSSLHYSITPVLTIRNLQSAMWILTSYFCLLTPVFGYCKRFRSAWVFFLS